MPYNIITQLYEYSTRNFGYTWESITIFEIVGCLVLINLCKHLLCMSLSISYFHRLFYENQRIIILSTHSNSFSVVYSNIFLLKIKSHLNHPYKYLQVYFFECNYGLKFFITKISRLIITNPNINYTTLFHINKGAVGKWQS